MLERGVWAVQYAKSFVEDVEFFAEDAGRADLVYLAKLIEAVIKVGATVVNLPDTTGYLLPHQIYVRICAFSFNHLQLSNLDESHETGIPFLEYRYQSLRRLVDQLLK